MLLISKSRFSYLVFYRPHDKQTLKTVELSSVNANAFIMDEFNCLPKDKILIRSSLKKCADKMKVAQMTKFVINCLENIVEKGENAGYQHFLLFP